MKWPRISRSNDSDDASEIDERFQELRQQLGDLEGIDRGPRDYSLAEEPFEFEEPPPEPLHLPRGWKLIALVMWLLVIITPLVFWLLHMHFTTLTGFLYGIVMTIACISLFASLREYRRDNDDGAQV